ncbi:MAG: hypothetical protein WDN46_23740 [Methylocella sp.]
MTRNLEASFKLIGFIEEHRKARLSINEAEERQKAIENTRGYMSDSQSRALYDEATKAFNDGVSGYDSALKSICEHRCAEPEDELMRLRYLAEAAAAYGWPDSGVDTDLFKPLLDGVREGEGLK